MSVSVILSADAPREEWEQLRYSGIGGSDVAVACGLSPWKTPYQLWLEKTGRVEPEFSDASLERMGWGQKLEPLLLAEFAARHPELTVEGAGGTFADDERSWMRANVDSLAYHADGTLAGIVECKTGNHRQVAKWADDQVPIEYVAQSQWYAHLLGAPRIYVVALLDTSTYLERVLERDDELCADLVELAAEFWERVQADTPPPVDGSEGTRQALSRWDAEPGTVVDLDRGWHKNLDYREELTEQIKALTAQRDQIDNELRAAMGAAEVAEIDEVKVATHRAPAKPTRTVDAELLDILAEDFPEVYAAVVTEKPANRRLTYATRKDTE